MIQVIEHLPSALLVRRNYITYYSRGVALVAFRLAPANYHGIQCWVAASGGGGGGGAEMAADRNETSNFMCDALDHRRQLSGVVSGE